MNFLTSKKARARKVVSVLGAVLGVLLFSVSLFSQANFGRILGIVTDTSGGVISNATVTIIDKDRGVARTLTTDDAGEYNAPTLIPSTYTVRVEAKGFRKLERQNVVLEVGKEVRVDLTPQPGEQTQTVTVTESLPLVETTNATLGGTLNNADINDMPLNGRNYQNLLSLRPGVMTYAGGSPWTQSTNNSRPDESVWMLDGVLNVNLYDYRPISSMPSPFTDGATILPIDAIQEFNLMENPKAEFGWRPGAVVNVGVRSGTNVLHGSAYAFGRDVSWDARNHYNTAKVGTQCVTNPQAPQICDQAPLSLKQFGGVVGGPIKKDKLFFFGGYEGLRSLVGNVFPATVPASATLGGDPGNSMVDAIAGLQAAGVRRSPVSEQLFGCTGDNPAQVSGPFPAVTCGGATDLIQNQPASTIGYNSGFPNQNTSNNGIGKIDYRLNSKNTINGMFLVGDYYAIGEDHPIVSANWMNGNPLRTYTVTSNWIWTPSSRLVNEARFGWDKVTFALTQLDGGLYADGKSYALNTGVKSTGGFPNVNIGSFAPLGGWRGRPTEFTNPYFDFQDSVSYLVGKHSFKFGGEYAHLHFDLNLHDTRGRIDFQSGKHVSISKVSTALEDFFAGTPSRAFLLVGTAPRHVTWGSYAGYIQDDWRVSPKLTVNLGLRYSFLSPLKEDNNLYGSFDPALGMVQQGQGSVGDTLWKPDHKDFSPRLGFAWDLSGKGTTVVRGGFSKIYSMFTGAQFMQSNQQNFRGGGLQVIPTGGCRVKVNPCPAGQTFGGTIDLGQVSITRGNLNWDPAIKGNLLNGGTVFPASAGVSCTSAGPCNLTTVTPDLLTPYMLNWSFGVTHAFTNNLSLEVSYVGNHGDNLTGFVDLNQLDANSPAELACGHCEDDANRPFAAKLDAAGQPMSYLRYISRTVNDARSNYHSLQTTLTERMSHGLSFTAGYTFGHGLDNGSLNRFGNLPQVNPAAEYGNSDFDARHRFTITATYNLPGIKGFGQLLEGWKLNTIVSLQSGLPWLFDDTGNDFAATGESTDRWNIFGNPGDFRSGPDSFMYCTGPGNGGCATYSGPYAQNVLACGSKVGTGPVPPGGFGGSCDATTSAALWAKCVAHDDPTRAASNLGAGGCFVSGNSVLTPPDTGTFGNMGRNIFRDSGFRNVDFSVFKKFSFKERYGAEFRVEMFNIFNHPIISNPYGAANGGASGMDPSAPQTLGCGCGTPDVVAGNPQLGSGTARNIQLGLKLTF
jgi:hypothetical protein